MTSPTTFNLLSFYATPEHPCSYLAERQAVTVFADPEFRKDTRLYTALSRYGFRRSGQHIYRPRCPSCEACVPVRVPVRDFAPRRSQRRAWRRNQDLRVAPRLPVFNQEHFALYNCYLEGRHKGGGMDDPTPRQYMEFLTCAWSDTVFYELRLGEDLLGVTVADRLEDGLSAVYTFFDPASAERSLGVFAILWQIAEARRLGMEWVYLGYWIEQSAKMRYKTEYQPLEYFRQGRWTRVSG
jgi:arginyl-tRNA--protein-N-Asp/Glu arginylyltransferase